MNSWFNAWQEKAKEQNAYLLMAHSRGDVPKPHIKLHCSSSITKRKVALKMINDFVEDFKANAPIWKYDLVDGKRVYAKERSHVLSGFGLLKADA